MYKVHRFSEINEGKHHKLANDLYRKIKEKMPGLNIEQNGLELKIFNNKNRICRISSEHLEILEDLLASYLSGLYYGLSVCEDDSQFEEGFEE